MTGTLRTPLPTFDDPVELAWLAGLLEGEGSFGLWRYRNRSGTKSLHPYVQLGMSDRDVVARAAALWGTSVTACRPPKANPHWKPHFRSVVSGTRARIVMEAVLPHMGARRATRIREVLEITNYKELAA